MKVIIVRNGRRQSVMSTMAEAVRSRVAAELRRLGVGNGGVAAALESLEEGLPVFAGGARFQRVF